MGLLPSSESENGGPQSTPVTPQRSTNSDGNLRIITVGDELIGQSRFLWNLCKGVPRFILPFQQKMYFPHIRFSKSSHTLKVLDGSELSEEGLKRVLELKNVDYFDLTTENKNPRDPDGPYRLNVLLEMNEDFLSKLDLIILCFDLTNTTSFLNVLHKWVPLLDENPAYKDVPRVLVGLKRDLRDNLYHQQYDAPSYQNKIDLDHTCMSEEINLLLTLELIHGNSLDTLDTRTAVSLSLTCKRFYSSAKNHYDIKFQMYLRDSFVHSFQGWNMSKLVNSPEYIEVKSENEDEKELTNETNDALGKMMQIVMNERPISFHRQD
eukprot:TRINITY_DN5336_c0_g1_i2.p1 TRINITY_DN5336_c0_g1~~TRINITY_DN5336_c0_g1_i2.p1  ORF type:complete len:322 (-),score=52.15 TRINITY_DN5336_c0_g1_i2:948-1913(-)